MSRKIGAFILVACFGLWTIYRIGELKSELRSAQEQVTKLKVLFRQTKSNLAVESLTIRSNASKSLEGFNLLRQDWEKFEHQYSPEIRKALEENLIAAAEAKRLMENEYKNSDAALAKLKVQFKSIEQLQEESIRQAASIRDLNDIEKLEQKAGEIESKLKTIEENAER
jgi:hypothetical protein